MDIREGEEAVDSVGEEEVVTIEDEGGNSQQDGRV